MNDSAAAPRPVTSGRFPLVPGRRVPHNSEVPRRPALKQSAMPAATRPGPRVTPLRPRPGSARLRREAVRRALGLMRGLDFNRVVDSRGLVSATLAPAAACALGLLFVWIDPALAATALVRLANPFGARDWPHLTQLGGLEA